MAEESEPATGDAHAVVGTRSVDIVVYLMLLAFAALLGFDNWRTGMSWEADGPQAGYFPFYLSLLLGAASLYGLVYKLVMERGPGETFVTGEQLRRVMQVFVPTLLFCVFMQWLGLHVARRTHCVVEGAGHRVPVLSHHVHHVRHRVRRHHAKRAAGSGLRTLGPRDGSFWPAAPGLQRPAHVQDAVLHDRRPGPWHLCRRVAGTWRTERCRDSIAPHLYDGPD